MKSVSMASLILAALAVLTPMRARAAETPTVKLVDMYAKAEGDHYKIHIVANGDISQYKTTRKRSGDSYKLTLDVPALPPLDQKYDLATPFSRRFEVWPMMLNNQVYARIAMTLALEASSVVGMETPSRIFITISRESATAVAKVEEETTEPLEAGTGPVETAPVSDRATGAPSDSTESSAPTPSKPPLYEEPQPGAAAAGESTAEQAPAPLSDEDNSEFFNLFPAPVEGSRPIFDVPIDQSRDEETLEGIRLGGFLVRPVLYASWIRGSNLLLLSDAQFDDSAVLLRFRTSFDYLHTENTLRFSYEVRFKDYRKFNLDDRFSHFVDFDTAWELTPRMMLKLTDHFARGNTESAEFDPGREVAFNTDPFYRNLARGTLQMDFSERMGVEFFGSYNLVQFVQGSLQFYDYNTTTTGGGFLYHMSPLTTLFGRYQRQVVPEPLGRPEAASRADAFLLGLRGELGPLMTGTVQAGYQRQEFGPAGEELFYRGFVTDVSIVRYFSDKTALSLDAGRRNNPSNFEDNGYYTSNFLNLQFVTPFWREFRLTARGSFIGNNYPLPASETAAPRRDTNLTAGVGFAYFFTRHGFFQVDFLHERRRSNLELYQYRNNVVQFLFGWGFLSQ